MKIFSGKVKSIKMKDTATVEVERFLSHPIYKKRFKKVRKYHVHVTRPVEIGETIKFVATRPISKLKKWKEVEKVFTKKGGK